MPKSVKRFLGEMRVKKAHAKKCEAVFGRNARKLKSQL
jgi:hypothetical protein